MRGLMTTRRDEIEATSPTQVSRTGVGKQRGIELSVRRVNGLGRMMVELVDWGGDGLMTNRSDGQRRRAGNDGSRCRLILAPVGSNEFEYGGRGRGGSRSWRSLNGTGR